MNELEESDGLEEEDEDVYGEEDEHLWAMYEEMVEEEEDGSFAEEM